jgi:hypothetical protein
MAIIKSSMADYMIKAHAITGDFGTYGIGVSRIEYYVNLVM